MQMGVYCTAISAFYNMPHTTKHFLQARLPFGNRLGSIPAVQFEWNLRCFQFFCLWLNPYSAYLISWCFSSTIKFCWLWITVPSFLSCMWNNANTLSSKQPMLLGSARAEYKSPTHPQCCLLVHLEKLNRNAPASSTFSKHSPCDWVAFFLPCSLPFFFASSTGPVWFPTVPLSTAVFFLLLSIQPVSPWLCFQANWEGASAKQGVRGEVDKGTSVSDTNMAQSQQKYYVCAPSFSATHQVIDPPPHTACFPFPHPPSGVCPLPTLTLSQSCYFGWKR